MAQCDAVVRFEDAKNEWPHVITTSTRRLVIGWNGSEFVLEEPNGPSRASKEFFYRKRSHSMQKCDPHFLFLS